MATKHPVTIPGRACPGRTRNRRLCSRGLFHLFSLLVIASLLFVPGLPLQAAPQPVELELGGAGSMPWDITNIKPGDSGTQMLTVRNNGTTSGLLYLWISDIVDTLGPTRPGVPVDPSESWKLSDHLLLEPISGLRSSTIPIPAKIADYPQSVDTVTKVTISPIAAGQTVDLTWEWHLPITVGNAIQANSLTFTLNYTLEEMPVAPPPGGGGGGPVPPTTTTATSPTATTPGPDEIFTFIITTPEKQESMEVKGDGTISESRTIDAISDNFTISFERDTRIVTLDNSITTELKISHPTFIPDPPPGHVIVGPVYELLFYTNDGPRPVRLTQPARVILNYAMLIIPEYVRTLFIASWDEENGWTQLQQVTGLVVGEGQLGALIDHFTLFTILGRIEDDEPPVIKPPLPARFDVDRLSLSVEQVQSGEPATVRVNVVNNGELQGEILLTLKVNGLFVDSQLVRLEPGQNRNVSFVLSTFKPGEYEVEVNGLRQVLVVTEGPVSEFEDTIARYWPMPAIPVLAGTAIILAVIAWLIVARKHA